MEYKNIKYIVRTTKLKNSVGYLYLDRIDKANALSIEMLEELNYLLDSLAKDSKLRVLIILSKGKHFCAGADLSWMKENDDVYQKASELLFDFLYKLDSLLVPKISIVTGACYGGGIGILGVSDIVISNTDARFCLSEAKLGIIPAIILPFLKKRLSYHSLINMGLRANIIDSTLGARIGLIDIRGSIEDLDSIINELLSCSLNSQIELKKHCNRIFYNDIDSSTLKDYCLSTLMRVKQSDEAKEGLGSFLNKKEPNWKDSLLD